MRRLSKLRALFVLGAMALFAIYNFVDITAIHRTEREGPARRLQIARITSDEITRRVGHVAPLVNDTPKHPSLAALHPVPPQTVIPGTRTPYQIPFLSVNAAKYPNIHKGDLTLSYDESDVVSPGDQTLHVLDKGPDIARKMFGANSAQAVATAKRDMKSVNSVISNEMIIKSEYGKKTYEREEKLISQANIMDIPVDKRKKLLLYLAKLNDEQFEAIYNSVLGKNVNKSKDELDKGVSKTTSSQQSDSLQGIVKCKISGCKEKTRLQPLRGYAGRVEVEAITLPVDYSASPQEERILSHRLDHVEEVCHKYGLDRPSPNNTINAWEFLINSKHKLVWCSIFKAASSTWFYNFNILAGYSEQRLLRARETPITLARRKYPRPTASELLKYMNQTDKPLSFMIVRHPLERLVSGYRDKLLSGRRYYSNLARRIVSLYPHLGETSQSNLGSESADMSTKLLNYLKITKSVIVPTFPQFVQFILDSHRKGEVLDEHWTPMYKFCSPCLFNFNVIAKMETLDEDGNYIIFRSGIENIIKPKLINRNKSAPTKSVADSFLCQLSRKMMLDLIDLYKYDLELFQYNADHYVNCTTDDVRLGTVLR